MLQTVLKSLLNLSINRRHCNTKPFGERAAGRAIHQNNLKYGTRECGQPGQGPLQLLQGKIQFRRHLLVGMKQCIDLVGGELAPIRTPPVSSNAEGKLQNAIARRSRSRAELTMRRRCRFLYGCIGRMRAAQSTRQALTQGHAIVGQQIAQGPSSCIRHGLSPSRTRDPSESYPSTATRM